MAKKTKRRQANQPTAKPRPATAPERASMAGTPELHFNDVSSQHSQQQPVLAPRKAVNAAKLPSTAAALIEPLPPEDASIPLDRVPYVTGDLLRVAIMAVIMVLLIIVGGIITVHYTSSLS